MIDLFTPRALIQAFEQIQPVHTWLRDTFFPEKPPVTTEAIDIDIYRQSGRRLATFQGRNLPARHVERDGYITRTFKPAYISEKRVTKAEDVMKREFGSHIYAPVRKQELLERLIAKDLSELTRRRERRLEWMAAQVMDSGSFTIQGEGVEDTLIDFGMRSDHKITLAGDDLWTDPDADPIEQLVEWADLVSDHSGVAATHCIMGNVARRLFITHPMVKDRLDTRRIELGIVDPQKMSPALRWLGYIKEADLNLYYYSEKYTDDWTDPQNPATLPIVPENKVWIASNQAYTGTYYGAIDDLDALQPVKAYVDSWVERDPKRRFLSIQSAPIVAMHQADAFLSAQVAA